MRPTDKDTDNNFTPLRLLLASLVVLGHFKIFIGVFTPEWPFDYAATAVDCFFVVSGYLVTYSFDRDSSLGRFYIRRFFRIYPLYIAVVVAQTVVLALVAQEGIRANLGDIGRYFFFNAIFANFAQHDIGHGVMSGLTDPSLNASLWTLKIEFAFYLLLPFIWRAVQRWGGKVLVIIFMLSAIYYEAFLLTDHYRIAKQLPGQMQYFVLGIAAYRYRPYRIMGRMPALFLTIALAALVTLLQRWFVPVVFPFAVAALVTVGALDAPRLRMKTDISYGVYLLHAPIIQLSLIFGLYRPDWIGLGGILAAVLVLAMATDRWIEQPGIALGRRLARRIKGGGRPKPGTFAPPAPALVEAPMTVVVLNDFCYVQGGASKVAIDEAVSLAQAGLPVIFIGAVGPACDELRQAGVTVECLEQNELQNFGRNPSVALQGLWNLKAARRTREILERLSPERTIVHLHGYTKALTTSPVRIARRLGFRVVCTLHDFFPACPNGAFFDYVANKPCERRALSAGCMVRHCDKRHYAHKLFRIVRGWIQRWGGAFPASVMEYIALSRRSAAVMKPYLPKGARLHPLQNVIDATRDPPVDAARNRTIVCVGRLEPEKGVMLVAELARQLKLPITFVGDGPLRAEVEAIEGVSVTGWVPADAVRRHLAGARCLLFPSLWYETYGLVVSEAAARGIPAIVSDISAAAERVEDGITGWRFRSGDAADLARCLKLIEDDAMVREAGRAAYRAFWANAETRETHADHLMKIYNLAMSTG